MDKFAAHISSSIIIAVSRIKASLAGLEKSKEAVTYYQKAVENEKLKYRLGLSTTLDIITTEDRLTSAQLSEVSAKQNYMTAIINLRFETGAILRASAEDTVVDVERITVWPF